MSNQPSQQDGHLAVAAIRVLEHREEHPPHPREIAQLIGWAEERVGFLLRGLLEAGIVRRVGSAFDERYGIEDHRKIEDLPAEDEDLGIAADLRAFDERAEQEQRKLEQLFAKGDEGSARKKRMDSLDDEFDRFKGSKPANPFGD